MRHDLVSKKFLLNLLSLIRHAGTGGALVVSPNVFFVSTHKSISHSSSAILHEVTTPISIKSEQS